jgi:riboflavin biosynthesis pyrimidine reductase
LGVEVETFETRDLAPVLRRLGEKQVVSLLVEGGPALHTALANAQLVDRLQWVVAPVRLGTGVPVSMLFTDVVAAGAVGRSTLLGDDRLTEFDVHRTD